MRHPKLREAPQRTTWRRTAVALSVGIAAGLAFAAPLSVSADVTVEKRELTAQQARMSHGKDLYNELCAVCHGMSGVGDGPAAEALTLPPIDLTRLAEGNDGVFPRATLEESIYGKSRVSAHGSLDMPVWGRAFEYTKPDWNRVRRINFAQHRIHNIVNYIETLQVEAAG